MPRFTSLLTGCEEYRQAYAIAYGITYQEVYRVKRDNSGCATNVVYLFSANLIRQTAFKMANSMIGCRSQSEAEMVIKMACEAAFTEASADAGEDLRLDHSSPARQAQRRINNAKARRQKAKIQ